MKLVERKKYNKIILISNIGIKLEGKEFVDLARKIIGNDIIALFFEFNNSNISWLKEYKNALISDNLDFCEEYLKCFEDNKTVELKIKSLVVKVQMHIGFLLNFDNDFLKYPLFKENGNYRDLEFNV